MTIEQSCELTGYAHAQYVTSLAAVGEPLQLPRSGGWVLTRKIAGTHYRDAMGPYPLFLCQDWSALGADLDELNGSLVSVAVVADPFGGHDPGMLTATFRDLVSPFKVHFVVDLARRFPEFVHRHHVRNARKGLQAVDVELLETPVVYLDDWVTLYRALSERHTIAGLLAFSRDAFASQLRVPGLVAFRADYRGQTVGMLLWYVSGDVGYYHLGAYSSLGYQIRASFALFWCAIEHFARAGLRWLNLGGGPGVSDTKSGLGRFKQGWSTHTRMVYHCGRVLDRSAYAALASPRETRPTSYFPHYREGEYA